MTRTQKQITRRRHTSAPASEQELKAYERKTLRRAEEVLALIEELTTKRR